MRKFTALLSIVAIAASALFVSCAQKIVPTLVPAFPSIKYATYELNKSGEFEWLYDSAYGYTNAKGVGFQNNAGARLEYVIEPNADWTATIEGNGVEYVAFRVGNNGYEGYDESQYTHGATVDGARGKRVLKFEVVKTPYKGETPVEVNVKMMMCGQNMTIATFTIYPSNEEAPVDQPDVPAPAADYVIDNESCMGGTIANLGDYYENGTATYTIELYNILFDEAGDPATSKTMAIEYVVAADVVDGAAANLTPDSDYNFAAGTYVPGFFDGDWYYGTIYVEMDFASETFAVNEPVNAGNISVSVADGIYTVQGDLTSTNGKTIKVNYVGELESADAASLLSRTAKGRPAKRLFSSALNFAKR